MNGNRLKKNQDLRKVPWLFRQTWSDLLFMHLPVDSKELIHFIPKGLELDTYEGQAWITIIPFKVTNMQLGKVPLPSCIHSFLEINVRTYVKRNHLSGVYFFSLDASNLVVVLGARIVTLPYYKAQMSLKKKKGINEFDSKRKWGDYTVFKAKYKPLYSSFLPQEDSLNYWLLERYYLWTYHNKCLYQGTIQHKPWKIQDVDVLLDKQSMLSEFQENMINGSALYSYAAFKNVLLSSIKKVK